MLAYLGRKLVYTIVGVGGAAAVTYLTGHHDIAEWTIKGLLGAVEAAVAGAALSPILGGSLSKKP